MHLVACHLRPLQLGTVPQPLPFFHVLDILKSLDLCLFLHDSSNIVFGRHTTATMPCSSCCIISGDKCCPPHPTVSNIVNLEQLVKPMSARFLHIRFIIFPFVIDYHLVEWYSEIILLSCSSANLYITSLALDYSFLNQPVLFCQMLVLYFCVCLYLLDVILLQRISLFHLFISIKWTPQA